MTQDLFEFRNIDCPACAGTDSEFIGWRGGEAHQSGIGVKTGIVRCQSCTHQYPNPMPFPKQTLDEVYINAEEYFRGHDVEAKKKNGLGLMKELEQRVGRRGTFLDVGCGAGELLWAAVESGWDAVGIDPSAEFIEIGRNKLGVEGRVTTLEDAAFPDNHFDAVVLGGIIEHLYDPYETLREVHRVLSPDGWLYFDAPNEDGLYMQIGNLYMRLLGRNWVVTLAPTFPPYHVQGFNPRSLRTILERADFSVRNLDINGVVCEQQGERSLRKKLEFAAARVVNRVGNALNKGSYMGIWAKRVGSK